MPEQIVLTLNPTGVAGPATRAVLISTQVVGTCLRLLAEDDLSSARLNSGLMGYQFSATDLPENERRELFENWLLAKGFQDLARGVREMLEEAVFYLEMMQFKSGMTTIDKLEADMAAIRSKAQNLKFPQLLEKVNGDLVEPVAFLSEYLSLQKVRNCLEHRNGRVTAKDIDPSTGSLTLSFPRLKAFYMRRDEEVEVVVGEIIDTGGIPDHPLKAEGGVQIMIRRVTRSRDYALGETIKITAADFAEIAMACHLFGGDLTSKLPTLPVPGNERPA